MVRWLGWSLVITAVVASAAAWHLGLLENPEVRRVLDRARDMADGALAPSSGLRSVGESEAARSRADWSSTELSVTLEPGEASRGTALVVRRGDLVRLTAGAPVRAAIVREGSEGAPQPEDVSSGGWIEARVDGELALYPAGQGREALTVEVALWRAAGGESEGQEGSGEETGESTGAAGAAPGAAPGDAVFTVPVAVVVALPRDPEAAEREREAAARSARELAKALGDATRYRAYLGEKHRPSLRYEVVETVEVADPLPVHAPEDARFSLEFKPTGPRSGSIDYRAIMEKVRVGWLVGSRRARQIWLYSRGGGSADFLMATPRPSPDIWRQGASYHQWYDGVVNRDRERHRFDRPIDVKFDAYDPLELPPASATYTLFHYSTGAGAAGCMWGHATHLETLLLHFDKRHATPRHLWKESLFWGLFVGSDQAYDLHVGRCGWSRRPPNGERTGDYANMKAVASDMEDWDPGGRGRRQPLSAERWGLSPERWLERWLQTIPGEGASLYHQGHGLRNWWTFVADPDEAMRRGFGLTY